MKKMKSEQQQKLEKLTIPIKIKGPYPECSNPVRVEPLEADDLENTPEDLISYLAVDKHTGQAYAFLRNHPCVATKRIEINRASAGPWMNVRPFEDLAKYIEEGRLDEMNTDVKLLNMATGK